MAINQRDADFFRPLWRRVLVTAVCTGWFAWESAGGAAFSIPGLFAVDWRGTPDQLWIVISGAALAYCVWNLFLRFPKDPPAAPKA